jgi:hypothetical protein
MNKTIVNASAKSAEERANETIARLRSVSITSSTSKALTDATHATLSAAPPAPCRRLLLSRINAIVEKDEDPDGSSNEPNATNLSRVNAIFKKDDDRGVAAPPALRRLPRVNAIVEKDEDPDVSSSVPNATNHRGPRIMNV